MKAKTSMLLIVGAFILAPTAYSQNTNLAHKDYFILKVVLTLPDSHPEYWELTDYFGGGSCKLIRINKPDSKTYIGQWKCPTADPMTGEKTIFGDLAVTYKGPDFCSKPPYCNENTTFAFKYANNIWNEYLIEIPKVVGGHSTTFIPEHTIAGKTITYYLYSLKGDNITK